MGDKPWKQEERDAAKVFGTERFKANTGGPIDFESKSFVGQVKHVKTMSLKQLEDLAMEMEVHGAVAKKIGVVTVKRRGGSGKPTVRLVVLTDSMWGKLLTLLGGDQCDRVGFGGEND